MPWRYSNMPKVKSQPPVPVAVKPAPKPTPKKASIPKKAARPRAPPMSAAHKFLLANRGCFGSESDVIEQEMSANSTGFGMKDPVMPENIYLRAPGNTGSVTTKTELGLIVTDFFDYNSYDPIAGGVPQEVTNYFWSIDQNLFENGSASPFDDRERTFCRVRKVEVYVLPVKGFELPAGVSDVNQTNATGHFTVNCQTPGVTTVNAQAAVAMDTQVTNVLPQIDTFWKKVFSCDLQKTFQSGTVRPYFDTVVDNTAQCLFQMSVVDPTTGRNYMPGTDEVPDFSIRVKVVMHVDQPIATIQNAKLKVFRNETFIAPSLATNGVPFSIPREEYVQINLRKKQDHMR